MASLSSGDFAVPTSAARANWLYYRNSIVTPFNLLKQQANWTSHLQNGGVVPAATMSALADTNPPSKKVSSAIGALLTTAEDPNDGPFRAYMSIMSPFIDFKGDLLPDEGWIERSYPSEPNWLAVWSFVKNNLPTAPSGMYNRTQYHLTKDVFLYLGNMSPEQRVYGIKFILAQHVDPDTGALLPSDSDAPYASGTFGLVTIQPSDAFLNGTDDLLLTPLTHVPSQGFANIVGSLVFMEIILRFIESQDVGGSYTYFGGVTVKARSANYPDIPLTLPSEQYAGWLRRTTSGTGLGVMNTNLKLQLVVPESAVGDSRGLHTTAQASGALVAQQTQTTSIAPVQDATPARSGMSPVVIAIIVIVVTAVIAVVIGVVVMLVMRKEHRGDISRDENFWGYPKFDGDLSAVPHQRQNVAHRHSGGQWESDPGFRRSSSLY